MTQMTSGQEARKQMMVSTGTYCAAHQHRSAPLTVWNPHGQIVCMERYQSSMRTRSDVTLAKRVPMKPNTMSANFLDLPHSRPSAEMKPAMALNFTYAAHDANWQNRMKDGAGIYVTATCTCEGSLDAQACHAGWVDGVMQALVCLNDQHTKPGGQGGCDHEAIRLHGYCLSPHLVEDEQHAAAQAIAEHKSGDKHNLGRRLACMHMRVSDG